MRERNGVDKGVTKSNLTPEYMKGQNTDLFAEDRLSSLSF